MKAISTLFDFDSKLQTLTKTLFKKGENNIERALDIPEFVCFDFNHPNDTIPETCHQKYDIFIIDPPFVTKEVWQQYAYASAFKYISFCDDFCANTIKLCELCKQHNC